MNEIIVNVTPTANELSNPKELICTENDCQSKFTNFTNLNLHLIKHHKIEKIKLKSNKNEIKQFFCPELDCQYNNSDLSKDNPKFFKCLKYLKQHYLKVHTEKQFKCEICEKLFPSIVIKETHKKTCGQVFNCDECGWKYNSKEALITHARRKKHKHLPDHSNITTTEHIFLQPKTVQLQTKHIQNILPKPVSLVPKLVQCQNNNVSCDQSIQTENAIKLKKKISKRKLSQTTQTFAKHQKNNETQTCILTSKASGTGTSTTETEIGYEKDSFEQFQIWKGNQNSSGTQTSPNKRNIQLFDESENDNSNLIDNSSQTQNNLNNMNYFEDSVSCFGSTTFDTGLCSIETQTDSKSLFNVMDTNLDQLDQIFSSSHMYTQTCDEILSEFGLSDIQTQTNWDYNDLLVSTETQTSFSQCLLENSSIQTQTIKSSELLNVMDAGVSESHSIHTQT